MRKNTNAYKTVVFDFFKEAMSVQTESGRRPIKVWLPKKFLKVSENPERPTMLTVKMPFWLFIRTPLCDFMDWSVEND